MGDTELRGIVSLDNTEPTEWLNLERMVSLKNAEFMGNTEPKER